MSSYEVSFESSKFSLLGGWDQNWHMKVGN